MHAFAIAPASARPLWVLVPVGVLLLAVVAALTISMLAARRATFEVSNQGLRLRGDFYGRLIPLEHLRVADARRVDFATSPDLRPGMRTMGTGMPGYQSGWFRLRNGESALLYLTDRRKAVLVPTTLGYSVLLSPNQPDEFLATLRRTIGAR